MQTFDCGNRSTAVITHPNKANDWLVINGTEFKFADGVFSHSFECSGMLTVDCGDHVDYRVKIIPLQDAGLFNDVFLLGLAGLLCGYLFSSVLNRYGV